MSKTPKLTCRYFKGEIGRLFAVEVAAQASGVEVAREDITYDEWYKEKKNEDRSFAPLSRLPVLVVGESSAANIVCETHAILTTVGGYTGFWSFDAFDNARATEILLNLDSAISGVPEKREQYNLDQTFELKDGEEKTKIRQEQVTPRIAYFYDRIEDIVGENGFAVGNKFTIVDFQIFFNLMYMMAGILDGIPKEVINPQKHPKLLKIFGNVKSDAKVGPIVGGLLAKMMPAPAEEKKE